MLLLYPREILILDLELSQTVGVVAIERSGVPFIQVSMRFAYQTCTLSSHYLIFSLNVLFLIFIYI